MLINNFFQKNKKIAELDKILLNLIYFFIGCIIFFVPVIVLSGILFPFIVPKYFLFLFFSEIIIFLYLFLIILYKDYRPQLLNNSLLYVLFAFIFITTISSLLGKDPIGSFWSNSARGDGVILLLHIFLFFLVLVFTTNKRKIINLFIWLSVVSSLIIVISVYTGFNFNIIDVPQNGGLLSNDSYSGTYVLFNIFFVIYLFFTYNNKYIRYLLLTIFLIILFSPVFLNINIIIGLVSLADIAKHPMVLIGDARGATAGLIIGLSLIFLFFFLKNKNKLFGLKTIFIKLIFFISIYFFIIMIIIPNNPIRNLLNDNTGGYRDMYWAQAIEGFKEKPLLGWGLNNFGLVNDKYKDVKVFNSNLKIGEINSDKAHGIIFDTLINSGLIGLIIYLSIFLFAISFLWKSLNITYETKTIFSALFLAYFLQNLVFFDFVLSYLLLFFTLGVIIVLDKNIINLPKTDFKFRGRHLFVIIFLIMLLVISLRYFVFLPVRQIQNNYFLHNLPDKVRSKLWSEYNNNSLFGLDDEIYFSWDHIYEYNIKKELITKEKNLEVYIVDIDNIISRIKKSIANRPGRIVNYISIFKLYVIRYEITMDAFSLNKMKETSLLMIDTYPYDLRGYLFYSMSLNYENKFEESLINLEKAYHFFPNNYDLNKMIIMTVAKINKPSLLTEKLERAQINLPTYNFNLAP